MSLSKSRHEIFAIVRDIFADELDVLLPKNTDIELFSLFDDAEIDAPVILTELEWQFNIQISDGEAECIETVDELITLIEDKIAENRESFN